MDTRTRITWSIVIAVALVCSALIAHAVSAQGTQNYESSTVAPGPGKSESEADTSRAVRVVSEATGRVQPSAGDSVGYQSSGPRRGRLGDSRAWPRTLVQGAMLARIVVSERSEVLRGDDFDRAEIDWLASVVINNGPRFRSARSWLDVMRKLSPHVTQAAPPTRPRHEWTSTLYGCTEAQPTGWVRERDGNWDSYALRWQSFCLDVRDRWVRGEFVHNADAFKWGNIDDSRKHICAASSPFCPLAAFVGVNGRTNVFFGFTGSPSCSAAVRESFVEAHCEGRR